MKKLLRPARNIIAYFIKNERLINSYKKELAKAKLKGLGFRVNN